MILAVAVTLTVRSFFNNVFFFFLGPISQGSPNNVSLINTTLPGDQVGGYDGRHKRAEHKEESVP